MPSLTHTIKTKGVLNTATRAMNIANRYGIKGEKMKDYMRQYADIIRKYDAKVTYPIPAFTLERNIAFIEEINEDIIEWAMHGYVHVDYRKYSSEEFREHLKIGKSIFKKNGIRISGFRAPYLSIEQKHLKEIENEGLAYDSSFSYDTGIFHKAIDGNKSAKKILEFYHLDSYAIQRYGKLTEIPVWLPDDELLIDRLKISEKEMNSYFRSILSLSKKQKSPAILQLHPERFPFFKRPLENFLKDAKKEGFELVTLKEIAETHSSDHHKRCNIIAITGDVDFITISDLKNMKKAEKKVK